MKAIVPLASEDPEFEGAGWDKPRPMIEVRNKPMVKWATECVEPLVAENSFVFPILQSHKENYDLDSRLRNLYGAGINIVPIEGMTEGPAQTVLEAEEYIGSDELLVLFGDQYISIPLEAELQSSDADGVLPVFESSDPQWSYARTDEDGKVIEVAEKEVISANAIPGLHHFSDGTDYLTAAKRMIEKDIRTHGVYKVSPVYNELIQMGRDIRTISLDKMIPLGSPAELRAFDREITEE